MNKFLTACWMDLIMVNYEVDPSLLASRVPPGTELDLYEGRCFVSLVGFMFVDTRVLGVPIPFHVNFEEVNLRFYVRRNVDRETRRAVVFIKEIVPRWAIAAVARVFYGEPYERWRMCHARTDLLVSYGWSKWDISNRLSIGVGENVGIPHQGSHGEFIIEHYWGYTDRGGGRVDEYKVEHPKWEVFTAKDLTISVEFCITYGEEFDFLSSAKPFSVLLAKGSEIAVYKGHRLNL